MPAKRIQIKPEEEALLRKSIVTGPNRLRKPELMVKLGWKKHFFDNAVNRLGLDLNRFKRGFLYEEERIEIIKRVQSGEIHAPIARDYAVSRVMIVKIMKSVDVEEVSQKEYKPFHPSIMEGDMTRNLVYRLDQFIPHRNCEASSHGNFTCLNCGRKRLNFSIYDAQSLRIMSCGKCKPKGV